MRARVGVTESHREPERDSESLREQEPEGAKKEASIPKHCFVAKQLNATLLS